jgi:hypothetical protein
LTTLAQAEAIRLALMLASQALGVHELRAVLGQPMRTSAPGRRRLGGAVSSGWQGLRASMVRRRG